MVAYLVAVFTRICGYTVFSIRAVEALAGSLTLLFLYLFTRQITNHKTAIVTLFLLAVSKWHLIYSRLGYRISLMLLFESATLYFLARALKSEKRNIAAFILAGVAAGLGFYTYTGFRIFPIVLIAFLLDRGIRQRLREHRAGLAVALITCLLCIAPLIKYFLAHPETFTYRMQSVAVWKSGQTPISAVAGSTRKTIEMLFYNGDQRPRQNVSGEPALPPFTSVFFLGGLLFALIHIRKPFSFFLLIYFLAGLIPGILSIDAPHAGRTLGSLPPVLILSSVGLLAVASRLGKLERPFLIAILGANLLAGPNDALFRYSEALDSSSPLEGMNRLEARVADLLNSVGPGYDVYLSPQLFFHASIEYQTYQHSQHRLLLPQTNFQREGIKMAILVPEIRDLWWLRDEDGKNYFHWWSRAYGMETLWIRNQLNSIYTLPPEVLEQSDESLLLDLKRRFPHGKELQLRPFTVYLFG